MEEESHVELIWTILSICSSLCHSSASPLLRSERAAL
jgi:hypothetical protein